MPDKIEHYVVGTNTVINNTESIVNISFNPELWVFKLMTEEPKGVVCLVWFLDLFLWASYVFMIPYLCTIFKTPTCKKSKDMVYC